MILHTKPGLECYSYTKCEKLHTTVLNVTSGFCQELDKKYLHPPLYVYSNRIFTYPLYTTFSNENKLFKFEFQFKTFPS